MGMYFNPGNENFKEVLRNGTYVDKTMMIASVNHIMDYGNKYICLSRPRRFGKTIAGNMLSAYYSKGCDSKELFAPYRIASDPDFNDPNGRRNTQNVIKIDMNSEYQNTLDKSCMIRRLMEKIKDRGTLCGDC